MYTYRELLPHPECLRDVSQSTECGPEAQQRQTASIRVNASGVN